MKLTLVLISLTVAAQAGHACQDTPVVWTIYSNYTDPGTGLAIASAITGDGAQLDSSGNTVYSGTSVLARLNNCGTHPSYDATLELASGKHPRTFNVNLGTQLGNDYQKFPPTFSFFKETGLLNISDIMWCQNNGLPNGCTFYTGMTSAITGPDGNTYHLRMEDSSVSITSWTPDATANCPYATSPVQVVFTPGSRTASGRDTYVVTPVLRGTNTGSGWIAPPQTNGCPVNTSLPAGTWPAAIGVLIQGTTGNSYNYGQYDTPFQFVIQNQ